MNRTSLWEMKESVKGISRLVVANCLFMVVVSKVCEVVGSGGTSDW